MGTKCYFFGKNKKLATDQPTCHRSTNLPPIDQLATDRPTCHRSTYLPQLDQLAPGGNMGLCGKISKVFPNWGGGWGDMIWPTKRQWQWKRQRSCQRQWQWQRQRHLENTLKERPMRLLTFQTFDQSDKDTWPDQQKDMIKKMTNAITKTIAKARTMGYDTILLWLMKCNVNTLVRF